MLTEATALLTPAKSAASYHLLDILYIMPVKACFTHCSLLLNLSCNFWPKHTITFLHAALWQKSAVFKNNCCRIHLCYTIWKSICSSCDGEICLPVGFLLIHFANAPYPLCMMSCYKTGSCKVSCSGTHFHSASRITLLLACARKNINKVTKKHHRKVNKGSVGLWFPK